MAGNNINGISLPWGSTLALSGTAFTALDLIATSTSTGWNSQVRFANGTGAVRHIITDEYNPGADNGKLQIFPGQGGGALNALQVRGDLEVLQYLYVGPNANTVRANMAAAHSISTYAYTPTYSIYAENGIETNLVHVDIEANWADYVFDKQYKLMNLPQLEAYINLQHHLPDMPSAKEVCERGIELGDMQNKLTQKIEELTLFIIQLQKQMTAQQEEINTLKISLDK